MIIKSVGLLLAIMMCLCLFHCQSEPTWKHFQDGIQVVLEAESKGDPSIDVENIKKVAEIIESRITEFGFKNRIVKINDNRQIVIQLPPYKNPDRIVQLISKPANLEFKLVDEEYSLDDALNGNIPNDDVILYMEDETTVNSIKMPFLLKRKVLLSGKYLDDVSVSINRYNEPYIIISFNLEGSRIFEKITDENIDRKLAIVLDNIVNATPIIKEKISGGKAQITGNFTIEEARDLSIALKSGGLPVNVKIVEYKTLEKKDFLGSGKK
jgi:preprotein translocase subunit SecD